MGLFIGQAWFSPRVPTAALKAWASNGGSIAHAQISGTQATYLFCDGNDDPWFCELYQRSMAIFHWLWIPTVVNAQFRVSISAYAIDEHTAPHSSQRPVPAYRRDIARHVDPESTPCARRNQGNVYDTPQAAPTNLVGNDVHITVTALKNAKSHATPNNMKCATPGSSRRKPKSVPFVDLRIVCESHQWSKSTRIKAKQKRIALYATQESRPKILSPEPDSNAHKELRASIPSATSGSSSQAISVSAALESLSHVSIDGATQFLPGAVHQGKEFRCFYTR
ncbi:hypothetical protein C2E23DRAFT_272431 [Lenzites betulinus]|nr:hypothetical protein C2E23DRAFT_272431 [Lenzites betulinus]